MLDLLRRFRGLAIALAVLAISAGAVFAGAPALAPTGARVQAEEAPAADPAVTSSKDEDADDEADEEDGEKPADNHGAVVSNAAHVKTLPEGFANHGQYVSCVARMEIADPATFDLATVTAESCGITPDETRATGKDRAAEKQAAGKAKAEAAKAKAAAKRAAKAQAQP